MDQTNCSDPQKAGSEITYNTHLDNFYGVLCLFCFIFGTAGNGASLLYFIRKKKEIATIIYTAVVIVDTLISILTLPVAVSYFDNRNMVFFSSQLFCDVWAVSWLTLSRMSVFLVAIMSITRAYYITLPFSKIKERTMCVVIGSAFAIHTLGSSIPLWYQQDAAHFFIPEVAACIAYNATCMPTEATKAVEVFDYIGITIPIPIIIISFILIVVRLRKKRVAARGGELEENNITATATVTLFTGIYLLFNVPAAIVVLMYYNELLEIDSKTVYLIAYMFMLVIPLNAACNPIIYFWRMKQMREETLTAIKMLRVRYVAS